MMRMRVEAEIYAGCSEIDLGGNDSLSLTGVVVKKFHRTFLSVNECSFLNTEVLHEL